MIDKQIEELFIENIKSNIGKNKPISKDDIIYFANEYGIDISKREGIEKILDKVLDSNLIEKLYGYFKEYTYIPNWRVAQYFGIETYQLNKLKENNLIKADTKLGSFYDRKSKSNIEYDLYNIDILSEYTSEKLVDLYDKAFNHSKYNIRLETKTKDDVQIIINELKKIFTTSEYTIYDHRDGKGYYSYFNISTMNNTEQEANVLLTTINNLNNKIKEIENENRNLKKVRDKLEANNFMLSREIKCLESSLNTSKAYIELLERKHECSSIKNERGAGRKQKFNEKQVEEILNAREGKSIRTLAKEFNCSVGLIHKIINEHNG